MIEEKYGLLTVLSSAPSKSGSKMWLCKCDCGETKTVSGSNLRSGNSRSCGCIHRAELVARNKSLATGHTNTPTYRSWSAARSRCNNENDPAYNRYGGAGIGFSAHWDSFENFYADMGPRPHGTTLDRINNEKGYEPGNCRWATWFEQANNKANNVFLTVGSMTMSPIEWAELTRIKEGTIRARMKSGWDKERIIREAPRGRRR